MSDTPSRGLARSFPKSPDIAASIMPQSDVFDDLNAIANTIKKADRGWDISQQAALAITTIAQQSATIGSLLEGVVGATTDAQAINVTGRLSAANVTIDGLNVLAADIDRHLNGLTVDVRHIGNVLGEELSCISGQAKVIARKLCGTEYDAFCADLRRNGATEHPGPGTARGPHEPVPDHSVVVLGHQLTVIIENLRERTETRFAEIEAARLAAAERHREQQETMAAVRAWQDDHRHRLQRLTETLEVAVANRDLTEAMMSLEARIETRLADVAAERDAQARRAADTYDRVIALLATYEPLRERMAELPEVIIATMESRVADMLTRMGARVEERLAHFADRDAVQTAQVTELRDELRSQQHQQTVQRDRLQQLPGEITGTIERLLTQNRADLESMLDSRFAAVAREAETGSEPRSPPSAKPRQRR